MTQQTFTDNVLIDGSQDIEQLRVQGHSTQTEALQTWEDSSGDVLAQVTGDGRFIVGDDVSPDSLIEAHRLEASTSKPKRGIHSLGQVSGTLNALVQWIVGELELKGSTAIDALHTALRIRASNINTGTPTGNAELRGADVEVINDASAGAAALPKATGLQVSVTNASDKTITEAIGLKVKIANDGTITNPFSIYTEGEGPLHFEDYMEVKTLEESPGTPPADFMRIYPKSDGNLYAKNESGTEFDLTSGGGGAVSSVNSQTGDVVLDSDDIAEGSTNLYYANERVDDRVNALLLTDASIAKVYDDGGNTLSLYGVNPVFQARLTPTTGVPIVTADATAVTEVFLTPFDGNLVAVYDGTRTRTRVLASDISIKLTAVQTGVLNGTTTVTGLTDTSQFIVGMKISGTNIPANTTIASIASATSITMNNAATGSGSVSLTFKVPANTMLDKFVYWDSANSVLKLEMVKWTNTTTRATAITLQDGYKVKSGDATRRFVGCVLTTGVDGQTERSHGTDNAASTSANLGGKCYIVNYYNSKPFAVEFKDQTQHTYGTTTWRVWLTNANALLQWISCFGEDELTMHLQALMAGSLAAVSVSLNTTSSGLNDNPMVYETGIGGQYEAGASHRMATRVGLNYGQINEVGQSGATTFTLVYAHAVVPA